MFLRSLSLSYEKASKSRKVSSENSLEISYFFLFLVIDSIQAQSIHSGTTKIVLN